MISIQRNPKNKKQPFRVVNGGKNGEPLKPSETFTTKQSAWKNIIADAKENYFGCSHVFVMDMTVKKPCGYWYNIETKAKQVGYKDQQPV